MILARLAGRRFAYLKVFITKASGISFLRSLPCYFFSLVCLCSFDKTSLFSSNNLSFFNSFNN